MSPRATRCVRQPRDRGQAPRGRTNGDPAGRRRSARRALGRLAGQRPVDRRRQPLRRAPAVRSASPAFAWMRSSLPTPARLLRRTSCSGPRLRSPLLSVGIRASPSSTDQTPQARAPAWCARRRRSPDRGTRRRVSCLTPALPRRADRREGASCFGRNPSYDVPNNRDVACLLRSNSRARDHSAATALASNARASREPGRTVAPRPRRPCAALWRRRSHPGGKQAPADAPVPLRDCSVVDAGACCAPGRRRLAAACGRCSTTSVSQAARL
jgi:hypothetical protein